MSYLSLKDLCTTQDQGIALSLTSRNGVPFLECLVLWNRNWTANATSEMAGNRFSRCELVKKVQQEILLVLCVIGKMKLSLRCRKQTFSFWPANRREHYSVSPHADSAAAKSRGRKGRRPFVIQHSISLIICSFNQHNEKSTEAKRPSFWRLMSEIRKHFVHFGRRFLDFTSRQTWKKLAMHSTRWQSRSGSAL